MWLSNKWLELFKISKETVDAQREDLASLRVERDSLQRQLSQTQVMNDWLRVRVNGLEMERTALLEKSYGIKLPTPELVKQPVMGQDTKQPDFTFDDLGDQVAKRLGLPVHSSNGDYHN